MVRVGILGIGFMGMTHFKAWKNVKGAKVTAIFTRDEHKLRGDWRGVKGNFGGAGGVQKLATIDRHHKIGELLSNPNVDLVDICLPTHMHREVAVAAFHKGKDVLVEKPIALALPDADVMIAAAKDAKKQLMVAHVLRFFPAFAEAADIVSSKQYGKVLGVHLKRVISRPAWVKDANFDSVSLSGGPALDLHIHDTDFIHHLFGVPQTVRSTGFSEKNGAVTYLNTQYIYEDKYKNCVITAQSGAVAMPTIRFEHGFDIYLEKATLRFNNIVTGEQLWIYEQEKKRAYRPKRKEAFVAQLQHVSDCLTEGKPSKLVGADNARAALSVCLKEIQSVKSGRVVRI